MAHFAEVKNGVIGQVIVVANEVLEGKEFPDSEPIGIAFCKSLFGENTEWLQTSYNGKFRGRFAGSGMTYDPTTDEFKADDPTGNQ